MQVAAKSWIMSRVVIGTRRDGTGLPQVLSRLVSFGLGLENLETFRPSLVFYCLVNPQIMSCLVESLET